MFFNFYLKIKKATDVSPLSKNHTATQVHTPDCSSKIICFLNSFLITQRMQFSGQLIQVLFHQKSLFSKT